MLARVTGMLKSKLEAISISTIYIYKHFTGFKRNTFTDKYYYASGFRIKSGIEDFPYSTPVNPVDMLRR